MTTYRIIVKSQSRFRGWTLKEKNLKSSTAYNRVAYYEDIYGVGNAKVIKEQGKIKQIKDM